MSKCTRWEITFDNVCPIVQSIYSNGSLLIYDMTLRDEGIYHCSFSDYDPVIIFFNVSLNRDSESKKIMTVLGKTDRLARNKNVFHL